MMNIKILFTAIISCFVSVASAQNEIGLPLRSFDGGINNNAASIALKPNESPDALNVVIDEPWGQAKTRNGFLTCGSIPSGNTITNTYEYIRSNGVHELILTDNTNVYSTIDCVNFSSVTTGLSSIAAPYFDTFRDKLWIVNKSTHAMTWDGTTRTLLDGVGTRPNPPIAQYVTHWKERVWMARTTTEPSAIYFTDLTNESGTNIDPSVSSAAWPTLNSIWIAEEDGSPIYGIKVYRDRLFVFKETGIWSIIFESNLDVQVVKAVSNVGCKFQDSIVELDNFLYFVGNDGIYKFDGVEVVRISDNIQATFNRLKQPAARDGFQLWDTVTDFSRGVFSASTATPRGVELLSISSPTFSNYSGAVSLCSKYGASVSCETTNTCLSYPVNPTSYTTHITTSSANWGVWGMSFSFSDTGAGNKAEYYFISSLVNPVGSSGYSVYTDSGSIRLYRNDSGIKTLLGAYNKPAANPNTVLYVKRFYNGATAVYHNSTLAISATDTTYISSTTHTVFTATATYTCTGVSGEDAPYSWGVSLSSYPYNTGYGNFYSEISTYSSLSAWRSFDVNEVLGGQTINYYVRTATSSHNVGLASWQSINSGQVISTTTNQNFQWRAELYLSNNNNSPILDAITANYREGDATSTRLQAINYKNRYMLTGSTTAANNYNDILIIKTRTPLDNWMVYDWQVSSLSKWNTYLYGGISQSANVARFDYGSNDNGSAINAYWTWGDQHWDRLSYKKNLKEIYGFYIPTQSSANTYIGYSYDGGSTWTNKTVDMTGSTYFGTKKLLINGGVGNAFRFRIGNSSLDQSFNVLGIDVWALPYAYRE